MRLARISLVLACAAALSCTALIGTKDLFYEADGGGPSSNEAGGDGPITPPTDGGVDTGPGACGDVMTSALNCGRCGHSCLGGACSAGQCQPVMLASGISPRDLAVDKNHVYWIEPSTARAMQADKDGKNPIQLGGGTQNLLVGLAIDDANVYWNSRDEVILRCKIGGCGNTPTVVSNDATYVFKLAVDATNVYWLESTSPDHVRKAPKTGTMATATTIAVDAPDAGSGGFNRVVSDGSFIYWTSDDGLVRRVAPGGGTVTVVGKGLGAAGGLAVDDANIYWISGDTPGTINRGPKTGTPNLGAPLAASQDLPLAVAVDTNSIYWVNASIGTSQTSGVIMTCSLAACTPKPLATGQRTPVAIAVDDTAIYWSNFDLGNAGGSIMRLAK